MGWRVGWLVGCRVGWPVGPDGRCVGCRDGWLLGRPVGCPDGSTGWPPAITSTSLGLTMLPFTSMFCTIDMRFSPYGPVTDPKSAAEMYCNVW